MWSGLPKRIRRTTGVTPIVPRTHKLAARSYVNNLNSIFLRLKIPVPFSAQETWNVKCRLNLRPGSASGNMTPELELVRGLVRRGRRRERVRVRTSVVEEAQQPAPSTARVVMHDDDEAKDPQELRISSTTKNGTNFNPAVCDHLGTSEQAKRSISTKRVQVQIHKPQPDDEDEGLTTDLETEEEDTEIYDGSIISIV